jgi:hypothetical protein
VRRAVAVKSRIPGIERSRPTTGTCSATASRWRATTRIRPSSSRISLGRLGLGRQEQAKQAGVGVFEEGAEGGHNVAGTGGMTIPNSCNSPRTELRRAAPDVFA